MPVYITPEGYRTLVTEYEALMKSERPRITAEVQYAASLGDRSENAEYQYGKQRLREIDKRLRFLQKRLEAIEVVDPAEFSGPVIRFGAWVTLEDEEGEEVVFRIVGLDEIDAKAGLISYQAPLGKALIGMSSGDVVTVVAPGGNRELEVLGVRYPEKD